MEIKELFDKAENGTLTYEQFEAATKEGKAKFVDLSEGKYVSVNKYNDDLAAKDKEIETLNGTITTRDTDLAGLKQQLADAGADATKLQELTDTLSGLQTKYDNDTKAYKDQLKKQAYEFAVREFANGKKFTSNAAKRDFVQSMIKAELKMDKDNMILGGDDFVTSYSKDNSDAFEVETPPAGDDGGNGGQGAPNNGNTPPQFISTTPGGAGGNNGSNGSGFNFNFTGVRPKPNE